MNEFSLLTDDMVHCYQCARQGRLRKALTVRAIFCDGTDNDVIRSHQDGLVVPICWTCNLKLTMDERKQHALHVEGQLAFEQAYPNRSFYKRYGKDYLLIKGRKAIT